MHGAMLADYYSNESVPMRLLGDAERQCICSAAVVTRYQKRLSGPLLDRIDIHVECRTSTMTSSRPSASKARGC
jgi:predicted ATPase with chaperone activity